MSRRGTVGRITCFSLSVAFLLTGMTFAIVGASLNEDADSPGDVLRVESYLQLGIALSICAIPWMLGALLWTQAASLGAREGQQPAGAAPFPGAMAPSGPAFPSPPSPVAQQFPPQGVQQPGYPPQSSPPQSSPPQQ